MPQIMQGSHCRKSFAIAGCLTEVVVMGAIGDVFKFGRANPAKVAAAGSKSSKFKVRFNDDLIHDLRVLKVLLSMRSTRPSVNLVAWPASSSRENN